MPASFEMADPDVQRDPYPHYHAQRRESPIHHRVFNEQFHVWWMTRYRDIVEVLKDPRFSAGKVPPAMMSQLVQVDPETLPPVARLTLDAMLVRDPPEHTRLRNLVNRAFTPRTVEKLRPRIQQIADELVNAVLANGELEIMRDLASPLPVIVISELLGFPQEDRDRIKRWSDDLAPLIDGTERDAKLFQIANTASEFGDYVRSVLERRRSDPRDDLLSQLISAHVDQDRLTESELVATVILVLGAGHETTTNLIGNGLLALLAHPDEMARLRVEPVLLPNAIEEVLRFDSPVQVTSRLTLEDIEMGGVCIPQGHEVDVVLAAGNRDPEVFEAPDRFDIGRQGITHLSFGHGVHFCLGAPLARAEGQIAIGTLLRRLPELGYEPDALVRKTGVVLRGLESFPVSF